VPRVQFDIDQGSSGSSLDKDRKAVSRQNSASSSSRSGLKKTGSQWFPDPEADASEPCCTTPAWVTRVRRNTRSMFLFSETSWPRRKATELVNHRRFDYAVMALIFANCIILAMADPVADSDDEFQTTGAFHFVPCAGALLSGVSMR
jgi:hypothetical protein